MPATIITGLQWGDEGKGKMVDHLGENADAVARFSGGANAGHTVEIDGTRLALHQLPIGLLRSGVAGIIGAACVLDPVALAEEVATLDSEGISVLGRLMISGKVHLVHPAGRFTETINEGRRGGSSVGTTRRGIGPTYVRKFMRKGLRLEDAAVNGLLEKKSAAVTADCIHTLELDAAAQEALRSEEAEFLECTLKLVEHARDVSLYLNDLLDRDGTLLAEGAQGTLLDPDHGTYPFVTCGPCVSGGACLSLGIGPTRIDEVVGIAKAYTTRVGNGPFPTELTGELGARIREQGNEYGATTGRPRRCGWFDAVLTNYSARINGSSWITLTLLDVLSGLPELKVCRKYDLDPEIELSLFETGARLEKHRPVYETLPGWKEDIRGVREWGALPAEARDYVEYIEELVEVPIRAISTGPGREDLIWRTK